MHAGYGNMTIAPAASARDALLAGPGAIPVALLSASPADLGDGGAVPAGAAITSRISSVRVTSHLLSAMIRAEVWRAGLTGALSSALRPIRARKSCDSIATSRCAPRITRPEAGIIQSRPTDKTRAIGPCGLIASRSCVPDPAARSRAGSWCCQPTSHRTASRSGRR